MKSVWIVEMLNTWYLSKGPQWEPTVGIGLSRSHGRMKLKNWQAKCPDDNFRLRRYAAPGQGEKK